MSNGLLPGETKNQEALWTRQQNSYREVLPFHEDRQDLARLALAPEQTANALIGQLLEDGTVDQRLTPAESAPFSLWHQSIRSAERLQGRRPLGLGFPLALFRQDGALRLAPLLIWEMRLDPPADGARSWRLWRTAEQRVYYNHWFLAQFQAGLPPELAGRMRSWQRGGPAGEAELQEFLRELGAVLGWEVPGPDAELQACPSLAELDKLSEKGALLWTGVLGLFPPPDPVDQVLNLQELLGAGEVAAEGHAFGLLELDPYQATAFQSIRGQRLSLVSGGPGAGKTHLLIQLLSNALSNRRRCLVVAPALHTLQDLHEQLTRMGLSPMAFLASNPEREGPLLLDMLRAAADVPLSVAGRHEEARFQQFLNKWEREKQKLDDSYRALRRPVFGEHNWADAVGLFLTSNHKEGKELLAGQLPGQDFRFRYEEHQQLQQIIGEGRVLYGRINTLRHALQVLHPSVFLDRSRDEGKAFATEQIDIFSRKVNRLHKIFLAKINDYTDQLMRYYESWYDRQAEPARALLEKMAEGVERHGRDFELTSLTSLRLYGAILPGIRAMLKTKQEVFEQYRQLEAEFRKESYFDFDFAPAADGRQLPRMRESLRGFLTALAAWREQVPALVQEEIGRLNSKTVHPKINFQGHILELEEALDLQIEELNNAALFEERFSNRTLTILKRRRYVEELVELLENTRMFLGDFNNFYDWWRFWLRLPETGRKLLRALIKAKPADWAAAFDSWYLNNCLLQAYDPNLPSREPNLRQYVFNFEQLRDLLIPQINNSWQERRSEVLKELRRQDRRLFNLLFGRRRHGDFSGRDLWELFRLDWNRISNMFPIWLLTPAMAQWLDLPEGSFDWVFVEDAQGLSTAQAAPALRLAAQRVLFANEQNAPLGPDPSLWQQACRQGTPVFSLPLVHRPAPGNPLQQRERRFGSDARESEFVRIESFPGTYDPRRGVNEEEARQIIRLLYMVEKTPQRTYPSIAIITLSAAQRDFIQHSLEEIRRQQLPGEELIQQLERNGLGVYHLQEWTGAQVDLLFLSATYGPEADPGLLELDLPEGQARLSLLMSRPRKGLFIVHSFSKEVLASFSTRYDRSGTFLLAQYLSYVQAVQEKDENRRQQVLRELDVFFAAASSAEPPSPFLREVALSLHPYHDQRRLHLQLQEKSCFLPLKIDPAQGQSSPLVLLPDGFFGPTPATDYRWEFRQWEQNVAQGYTLLPIWSVNWWKNAPLEARRLAGIIARHDDGETEETA